MSSDLKLMELLSTVDDARKSLEQWQDQRTDAMMSLDVIRANVESLQDEKRAIEEKLQSIASEHTVKNELFESQVQMIHEENKQLQEMLTAQTNQNITLVTELQNVREAMAIQKAEYEMKIATFEERSDITLAEERDFFLTEREDLRTEAMNHIQKIEEYSVKIAVLENERDELREVVFEEAIESVKSGKNKSNRPKFIMDYLKRVGYEVPEED